MPVVPTRATGAATLITVTDAGVAYLERLRQGRAETIGSLVEQLSPAHRRALSQAVEAMAELVTLPVAKGSILMPDHQGGLLNQPRAVFAVAFACVVSFMGIGLVDPILPALAQKLKASPSQVELLFTSYLVITALGHAGHGLGFEPCRGQANSDCGPFPDCRVRRPGQLEPIRSAR